MGLFSKKKHGPQPAPPGPKTLENKHLASSPQFLGGGTANEVFKTTYRDGKGINGSTTGYFKEDADATVSKYAVGASSLAKGLDLGGLIPETRFAKHDITGSDGVRRKGVKGAVSKGASGDALSETVWDTDVNASVQAARDGGMSEAEIEMSFEGMYRKVGDNWFSNTGSEVADIDLQNPETQKGLNQLQWFDALIGNADRHAGNILVDPATGVVSGIDNDLTFGKGHAALDDKGGISPNWEKGQDSKYLGMPAMIDRALADKILDLDAKKIKKLLNPKGTKKSQKFDKEEIQQTVDRLTAIQAKIAELDANGLVVAGWDHTTYQAQINEDPSLRAHGGNKNPEAASYLQRHQIAMNKATDTNDASHWRAGHRQADTTPVPPPPVAQPQPVQAQAPPALAQPSADQSAVDQLPSLSSRVEGMPWGPLFKKKKQPV